MEVPADARKEKEAGMLDAAALGAGDYDHVPVEEGEDTKGRTPTP